MAALITCLFNKTSYLCRVTLSTKNHLLFFAENWNLKVEAVVGALTLSLAKGPFLCYCSSFSLVKQPDIWCYLLSSIPTMHQVLLRNVIYVYPCEYKFYVQILFQSPCFTKAGILFIALINSSYIYYLASFFPFFFGGGVIIFQKYYLYNCLNTSIKYDDIKFK